MLNSPILERSPYEHERLLPVPLAVFRYWTFYLPNDIILKFPPLESAPKDPIYMRVPVDGTCLLLHGQRSKEGRPILMANYTKPLPTACLSLHYDNGQWDDVARQEILHQGVVDAMDISGGDSSLLRKQMPELSKGFIFDGYDLDYYAAIKQMDLQGHPGFPQLTALFVEACVAQRDVRKFPNEKRYEKDLLDAIPALDPVVKRPLPFAFPPILYRLEQHLSKQTPKLPYLEHYPAINLYARLYDAADRAEGKRTNNANGAFDSMYERHGFDEQFKVRPLCVFFLKNLFLSLICSFKE